MEIVKNIQSFTKSKNIIHSCVTHQQLNSAEKYCKLYYHMFEDLVNYEKLVKEINTRRLEIDLIS